MVRVSSKEGGAGEASPPPLPQDIIIMKSTLPSPWPYNHVIRELPPEMKFLDETLKVCMEKQTTCFPIIIGVRGEFLILFSSISMNLFTVPIIIPLDVS